MSTALEMTLQHLGYAVRPQQRTLYDALMATDQRGVVVQAGTGTGKSIAVLAAAADWVRRSGGVAKSGEGEQVVIVTPTKVLQDQYMAKDAPAVMAATGVQIACLKGRKSYLCTAAPGMRNPRDADEELAAANCREQIYGGPDVPIETSQHRFGCPGSKRHREEDREWCQATLAREYALEADIVVTNLHILIFDDMLKANNEDAIGLLPDYGLLLLDEAHKVEETVRDFSSTTIAKRKLDNVYPHYRANPLIDMLSAADDDKIGERIVPASHELIAALVELSVGQQDDDEDEGDEEDEPSCVAAAKMFIEVGKSGHYEAGNAIMHFVPTAKHVVIPNPKLRLTWINLAARINGLLTKTPVGLVSATIPTSLPGNLGLNQARVLDVGHPFDYARQATLRISQHDGSFKTGVGTMSARCNELLAAIDATPGGALVLFSSFRDLNAVHDRLAPILERRGHLVLAQRDDADKADLSRRFLGWAGEKPAVLFGSESFATGFDAPGDALTLVAIWKLPYPGMSPVTKAISSQNFRRYEDMMRVSAAQAIGRLIRTETDRGTALILDSRGVKLLDPSDRMLSHLLTFGRS